MIMWRAVARRSVVVIDPYGNQSAAPDLVREISQNGRWLEKEGTTGGRWELKEDAEEVLKVYEYESGRRFRKFMDEGWEFGVEQVTND